MNTVYTSSTGYNAPVFRNLLKLYAQPFGHILDATYGAGGFWNQSRDLIDRGTLRATFMDIQNRPGVVEPGGVVLVKGQDDSRNFFVRELPLCGMKLIDCHVVTRTARPMMRHKYQLHARRNHSYFMVLRKK